MPYEGEILDTCGIINLDFSEAEVVAVSGDGPNVCGHLMIFNPKGGNYFHVTGDPNGKGLNRIRGYPMYMNQAGYQKYLKETGKSELRRKRLNLPNPMGATVYLEQMLAEKWTWGVLPNNCVAFVEDVIKAGGGDWSSASNCPVVAISDPLAERLASFYGWMESGVYSLYGVPR